MRNLLIVLAVLAASVSSCVTGGKGNKGTEELRMDSIAYSDSVVVNGNRAQCSLSVDFPVAGPDSLVGLIRTWIGDKLVSIQDSVVKKDSAEIVTLALDGKGSELLKKATEKFLDDSKSTFLTLPDKVEYPQDYTYIGDVRKVFSNDDYITLTYSSYVFLGGAHGGSVLCGQTFDIRDAKLLGWNIFRQSSHGELIALIKENLMSQYFDVKTEEELASQLLVPLAGLPLPVSVPYITSEGITFVYQQYEIAPYSAGMPKCTIPFSELRSLAEIELP